MSKVMVPISERALTQRLTRVLSRERGSRMKLKKSREGLEMSKLGKFYVLDIKANQIGPYGLDHAGLVKLARKHGAMADYETLVK